jgi:hypothetical protein
MCEINAHPPASNRQAFNGAGGCVERLRVKRSKAFIDEETVELVAPAAFCTCSLS